MFWRGNRVDLVGTGVKQGSPAGPLLFAVSTFELFESIRDAAEKLVFADAVLRRGHRLLQ